ncbi:MAG: hypothetical protein M1829_005586 [Trizodia sp. TS-e1964]|nr:MAG: hypothetical protein M1829_005586 [Trizodia sp. TS-e1964]
MASVSSLDQDLRNMRLSKYTPQAAAEIKIWIEEVLGDTLAPTDDLLESLKDGVLLCRLANLAIPPPGIRYKVSTMPFVQMENISHFLRACQAPPLNLQDHDVFLTVDLFEAKDPAQVLQCLAAFSRVANAVQPRRFKRVVGPKKLIPSRTGDRPTPLVSSRTGDGKASYGAQNDGTTGGTDSARMRGASIVSNGSTISQGGSSTFNPMLRTFTGGSNSSATSKSGKPTPTSSPPPRGGVSSWSKPSHMNTTSPAWNIHQYGYMGGASQGNQGISFGARRQITSPNPLMPSMADEKRRRLEQEEEEAAERQRQQEKYEEQQAETRARAARAEAEERKIAAERERELSAARAHAAEEKRRWAEQEAEWRKADEERRQTDAFATPPPLHPRPIHLQGQYLSQYQASVASSPSAPSPGRTEKLSQTDQAKIKELEEQLAKAREREREYERERMERNPHAANISSAAISPMAVKSPGGYLQIQKSHSAMESHDMSTHLHDRDLSSRTPSFEMEPGPEMKVQRQRQLEKKKESDSESESWRAAEREYLRGEWAEHHQQSPRPLPTSPRPLPDPLFYRAPNTPLKSVSSATPPPVPTNKPSPSAPSSFSNPKPTAFFSPAPSTPNSLSNTPHEPPSKTTPRPLPVPTASAPNTYSPSLSLLEREMQRERERQREWEADQLAKQDQTPGLDAERGMNSSGFLRAGVRGPRPPPST